MSIMKRIISLLLCVAMLAAYLPAAGSAAAAESNVYFATVDKTVVDVGDTVEVTLRNKDMTVAAIGAWIEFDTTMLECVSIVSGDPDPEYAYSFGLFDIDGVFSEGGCSTVEQANNVGTVGFVAGDGYDMSYLEGTIYVATFKALKKGTVTITAHEDSANEKGNVYKGEADSKTVTIKGPNVNLPVSETVVKVGETFEVTLRYTDMKVFSFNCGISYDSDMLKCVGIKGHNSDNYDKVYLWNGRSYVNGLSSTLEDAARESKVGFGKSGKTEATYKAHDLFTVTFEALKTGDTTITAYEYSDGQDGWENDTVDTQKITIKPDGCEHVDPDKDGDHTCDICQEPDVSEHITATKDETTPNSCTEEGRVETVTFCTDCGKELNRVVKETIPAGHTWGEPGYTWADDYSTCTAARSCTVCAEGKEEETVTASSKTTTSATCTEKGWTTHTADFAAKWAVDQTKTLQNVPENPNNHASTAFKYEDSKDGKTHKKIYACCQVVAEAQEAHSYVNHKCACGDVESYTVTWEDQDGNVIDSGSVDHGGNLDTEYPVPNKPGYSGVWGGTAENVTDHMVITPQYTPNNYSISWIVDGKPYTWTENDEPKTTTVVVYDTVIELPAVAPTKTGHTFEGWYTGENGTGEKIDVGTTYSFDNVGEPVVALAADVEISGQTTLYAHFTVDSYKVTFTINGEVYGEPVLIKYGETVTAPAYTAPEGHSFSGWTVPATMPAENLTINATLTVNSYKATFNVNGQVYDEKTVEYGKVITLPENPTKDNDGCTAYIFTGWEGYTEGMTMGTENVTFVASFTESDAHTGITHVEAKAPTCYENGNIEYWYCEACGQAWLDAECTKNTDLTAVVQPAAHGEITHVADKAATCTEEGNIEYWYCESCGQVWLNEGCTISSTLKAVVLPVDEDAHTESIVYLNLGAEGHKAYYPCCQNEEDAQVVPHDFGNDEHTCVCGAVETFTITWMNVDGTELGTTSASYGDTPAYAEPKYPNANPGYKYTFEGWANAANGEALTELPAVTGEATYYAVFTQTARTFLIDWMVKGWEAGDDETGYIQTSVMYGEPITAPKMTWLKEGYTFSGWQNVPANMPADNLVIYGEWTVNSYTVTWTVNGEQFDETKVEYGTAITAPEMTEEKEGYTFSGWTAPEKMPAEDITLDAVWTANTYTVTWNVDGNTDTKTTQTYGAALNLPTDPEKTGYIFAGWFTEAEGGDQVAAETVFKNANNDTVYYAQWTAKMYQINWRANGGYMFNNTYLTSTVTDQPFGAVIQTPPHNAYVQREGYTFTGWNTKADGTGEILTAETTMTEASNTAVVYYAQWEVNSYEVTFTINNEEYKTLTFTYGAAVTAPEYTIPEGHSFSGWTVPEKMPAEDLTIDASLTVNTYPIVLLDVNGNEIETREGNFGDMAWLYLPDGVASIAVNDENRIGTWMFNGLWLVVNGDGTETELAGTTTIPVDGLTVRAQYVFTGWVNDNGWHYEIENEIQKTGWTEISHADYLENGTGTDWYYLDPVTGNRSEGVARAPYPTEAINGVTYAPDQESIDYANKKGQTFIDEAEGWFIFDEDGKFQSNETGMGTYFGATRYAENGHIAWHPGMIAVGEDYYYFIGDVNEGGNILATGDVYISRNKTDRKFVMGGVYTFEDGKLCMYDGITDMADGSKRYYENAQLMIGKGLVKIGENYIYVRSNGELVVGEEYWVAKVNGHTEINVGMASFDKNGYMIVELDQTAKTGIYANGKNWVYYVEGCRQYNAGLVRLPEGIQWFDAENNVVKTADGESYVYVRSNGQLATGTYWITQTNGVMAIGKYDFDAYGVMLSQMNGVYLVENALVYYVDNQIAYNAGLIRHTGTSSEGVKYDNDWIYVRSNGQLATGTYWITNTNEEMASGKYTFDADGKMIVTKIADGIHEENGKLYYYQDGVKQVGTGLMQLSDGSYIYVKTTGELVVDTDYYVTNNHGLLPQAIYYFGADGIMVR